MADDEELLRKAYAITAHWDKLTPKFKEVCYNYAASTGTPIEMYIYTILAASAAMCRFSVITLDPDDDPDGDGEPAIFWSKVLAPSGSNKSGVFRQVSPQYIHIYMVN